MKKFIQYFRDFHRDYFHAGMYLACLGYIAALIVFNYSIDFEDSFIDRQFLGTGLRPLLFLLTHGVAYYGVIAIIFLFRRREMRLTPLFWIKSLAGFALLGIDRSVFVYYQLQDIVPPQTLTFYYRCASDLTSFFFMMLPLFAFRYIFDRSSGDGLYGITFRKVDFTPYFIMLGFMVPVLYLASFLPDIQSYYPLYKRAGGEAFARYYQLKEWVPKAIYEPIYISDFIFTELFFRGFLIVGFAKILGKDAVLPMAATYAALHFGKPLGETISSIFGGYILGVIALYSRNIWGGIFLHGGVAFLMEVFAFMKMRPHG